MIMLALSLPSFTYFLSYQDEQPCHDAQHNERKDDEDHHDNGSSLVIVSPYALLSSVEYAFQGAVYACGNSIAVS